MGAELVSTVRGPVDEQNEAVMAKLGPEKVKLIHKALDALEQML